MEEAGVYQYESSSFSHEYFSPGPESSKRKASARSAVFNLVSTIIGGGVLSLPFALNKCGLIIGTSLMILSAIASTFSLYVIVSCSRRGSVTTYEEIVRKALGNNAGFITVLLLVCLTFLSLVAYTVLSKDLLAALLEQFVFGRPLKPTEKNISTALWISLSLPVAFYKSMDALRFTSIFSLMSVLLLAIAISIRAIDTITRHSHSESTSETDMWLTLDTKPPIKWFPSSPLDVLYAFPIISVSFLCHFNVMPVYRELQKPTRKRLKRIVCFTMFGTWSFYMIVGIMGYLFAYQLPGGVKDDILNNFDTHDPLVNLGRLGLLGTILCSIPLIVQPCRTNVIRLGEYLYKDNEDSETLKEVSESMLSTYDEESISSSSSTSSGKVKLYAPEPSKIVHILLTLVIVLSAIALALIVPGVALVWNLMGSTVGILISYVLPCLSYICIRKQKRHSDIRKITSWIIFILSSILCIACSAQAIITVMFK